MKACIFYYLQELFTSSISEKGDLFDTGDGSRLWLTNHPAPLLKKGVTTPAPLLKKGGENRSLTLKTGSIDC